MKRVAILAFGLAALAGPASAAFLTNYAGWSKLSPTEKLAYVRGLNDASSVVDTGEAANAVQTAMVRGRTECLARDQVTGKMLVALIDARYQNDPSAKDLPPMTIFVTETYRICRQDIDAALDATRPSAGTTPKPQDPQPQP